MELEKGENDKGYNIEGFHSQDGGKIIQHQHGKKHGCLHDEPAYVAAH